VKEIPLTKGQVAIVDDEDYPSISGYKWQAQFVPAHDRYYALRAESAGATCRTTYMHAQIIGPAKGQHVHHISGVTLDNRRENLVAVTPEEHRAFHAGSRINMDALLTKRRERKEDRKSGVAIAARIPLTAYLQISDLLASQGGNVNQWLRGLALEWLASQTSPEHSELHPQAGA
jgi:hypothetical protein